MAGACWLPLNEVQKTIERRVCNCMYISSLLIEGIDRDASYFMFCILYIYTSHSSMITSEVPQPPRGQCPRKEDLCRRLTCVSGTRNIPCGECATTTQRILFITLFYSTPSTKGPFGWRLWKTCNIQQAESGGRHWLPFHFILLGVSQSGWKRRNFLSA